MAASGAVEREGVVRDEKTGELIIPASQRPDGTWRKARRVRDGYVPQEEVPVFESKGTQWLKSRPTHPIGLAPDDIAKMEQAKKAASESDQRVHTSKAAKKNAKRKEKKRQDKCGQNVSSDASQVTAAVQQINISSPEQPPARQDSSEDDKEKLAKKLKNLKKKLKQIEELERKISSGELKNPEKDQLEKVSKKQDVVDEIEDIELELF